MKLLWQGEAEIICVLVQRPYWFFHLPGYLSFLRAQWNALLCGLGSCPAPPPPQLSLGSGCDLCPTSLWPPSLHTHSPAAEHSVTLHRAYLCLLCQSLR